MDVFTMREPFDTHIHYRQGPLGVAIAKLIGPWCQAAIAEPNTKPPITDLEQARAYRAEIKRHLPVEFALYMALYLNSSTKFDDIARWRGSGVIVGKLYPEGVTTGAEQGVSDPTCLYGLFEAMEAHGIALSIHAAMPGSPWMSAEQDYHPVVRKIAERFPHLPISLEHLSDAMSVEMVLEYPNMVGTIMPQYMTMTSADIFAPDGKIHNPHNYWKPEMKTPVDRERIREAAFTSQGKFFYGSDCAAHLAIYKRLSSPPSGGCNYPAGIPILVEEFAREGCLDNLEAFTSTYAAKFHSIRLRDTKITLERVVSTVPESLSIVDDDQVIPWHYGEQVEWTLRAYGIS